MSTNPSAPLAQRHAHRLIQLGLILFVLGLLVGFAVPFLKNPRMGLTSHLEGVMNGMLLVLLGLVWPRLVLATRTSILAFWLVIYASFANWAATLLAAIWGAGRNLPLAAPHPTATALQETFVDILLVSLAAALLTACGLVLWGLRGVPQDRTEGDLPTAASAAAVTGAAVDP